ncbi:hypothetical protein ACFQV2_32365 [Actinokineospora soli]|uniref:Uncharacterized protein n=1 Tax=Actinokineospora soli TaxID=1048753 RepID=A0ABW2TXB8_9PSEU
MTALLAARPFPALDHCFWDRGALTVVARVAPDHPFAGSATRACWCWRPSSRPRAARWAAPTSGWPPSTRPCSASCRPAR